MIEKRDIICFGFAEWDNPYRTNQHQIMERLSAMNRVLFIESLGLRRPTLQKKDLTRIFRRIVKWLKGPRKIHDNLIVFAPLVLPFHKYSLIRRFNHWFLFRQLDKLVTRHRFNDPVLWSYIPNAAEFLGRWGEKLSVYHCVDEFSANPLIPAQVVRKMEEGLLKKIDIVLTTAPALYQSKKKSNPWTYYLPNVADFQNFHKAALPETPVAEQLLAIPEPRLGFVGAISAYKLDLALLLSVARSRPEWSIVLIGVRGEGEKEADITELEKQKNVHFLGGIPAKHIPPYLKGFDVCLLPNIINDYTRNMFPLKFFEYLAAGKPVVSTRLESLEEFKEHCYLSGTPADFEANITNALNENNPEAVRSRIDLARKYTWETRIEEISTILCKAMERKGIPVS